MRAPAASHDLLRHDLGNLEVRIVPDIVEGDERRSRKPVSDLLCDVRTRARVGHSPDEAFRHALALERRFPASRLLLPVSHEMRKTM